MSDRTISSVVAVACTAMLLLGEGRSTASTCAVGCSPCATTCDGGCPAPLPIGHGPDTCNADGAFDLSGTAYESSCATGSGGCTVSVPPFRFWQQGSFTAANQGCEDLGAAGQVAQASKDLGRPVADGHWVVDGMMWQGTGYDGCLTAAPGDRLVSEVSFVDTAREGTTAHRAFYAVTSVDATTPGFDLDQVSGGDGCNSATVRVAEVPRPDWWLSAFASPDPQNAMVWIDPARVAAHYFSELGRDSGSSPIAGFEVMYLRGPEPTSSDLCSAGWLPALSYPDATLAQGVIPFNSASVSVQIPGNCYPERVTDPAWIAYRLVYEDPLNPSGPYDLAVGPAPRLTTPVGAHVRLNPGEAPGADASIDSYLTAVAPSIPLKLFVSAYAYHTLIYSVEVGLPACLDTTDFDPIARPWQIEWKDGFATVVWNPVTRILAFNDYFPVSIGMYYDAVVHGLRTGGADPACCVTGAISWADYCGVVRESVSVPCMAIDPALSCPAAVPPVTGLRLVGNEYPSGAWDVTLSWDGATDPDTVSYNVYRVTGGDASILPVANQDEVLRRPDIQLVTFTPRADPTARDFSYDAPTPLPNLIFYQVRGVCSDGSEGRSHPY